VSFQSFHLTLIKPFTYREIFNKSNIKAIVNTRKEAPWMVELMELKTSLSPPNILPFSSFWQMFTSPKHLLLAKVMTANIHVNRMVGGKYRDIHWKVDAKGTSCCSLSIVHIMYNPTEFNKGSWK
jgi:hypothetical protein